MRRRGLLTLLLAALLTIPAHGTETEYTYTVRFFSGQQGTFGGSEMVVYENLHYGDRVSFRPESVTLTEDSKYYVKGIRESGKDNNTVQALSFSVTGDMDYVVAYGISGSSVAYRVNYQDADGNTLAPSSTYYGNVGDRPVIAYLYIQGYQPQAYNLMKTLVEDASENEFTFVYTALSGETATPSPSPSPTAEETTEETQEPEGETTGTEETPVADITREQETSPEIPAEETETPETPGEADTQTEESDPREIIDLDDPETPLGNLELSGYGTTTEPAQGNLYWVTLGGAAVLTVLLALLILLRTTKKKKEQEDEQDS